jgi:hypothetical protein
MYMLNSERALSSVNSTALVLKLVEDALPVTLKTSVVFVFRLKQAVLIMKSAALSLLSTKKLFV